MIPIYLLPLGVIVCYAGFWQERLLLLAGNTAAVFHVVTVSGSPRSPGLMTESTGTVGMALTNAVDVMFGSSAELPRRR